jgi:hypothetical protein
MAKIFSFDEFCDEVLDKAEGEETTGTDTDTDYYGGGEEGEEDTDEEGEDSETSEEGE